MRTLGKKGSEAISRAAATADMADYDGLQQMKSQKGVIVGTATTDEVINHNRNINRSEPEEGSIM